jgi:uncharacterized integral membrane protein
VSEQEQEPQDREARIEAAESRFERSLRYGHRTGLWVALVIAIAAIVFLILLISRNTRQVKLDYVAGDTQARLIWLIIVAAIVGWVLGIVTSFLVRHRTRRQG